MSVFCEKLFEKGIITLEDLTSEGNGVITGFQIMANYGDYRRNSHRVATSFKNVQ